MSDTPTQLQRYSLGIVAANKPLDSDTIEVVPIEETPFISGEITDNIEKYQGESQGIMNDTYKVEVDTTLSIKAKWLSGSDTNRITSPDVRRGEKVEIYRYADTDQYWWKTLHQGPERRLETVVWSFSNNSKENVLNGPDATYYAEVSTHKKTVSIHTAKNDGEPFIYDIQINAKEGNIVIQDDIGNTIVLDSKNQRITLKNSQESVVDLDKKNVNIFSLESVNIQTKRFTVEANESITTTTKAQKESSESHSVGTKNHSVSASDSATTSSPKVSLDSKNLVLKGSTSTKLSTGGLGIEAGGSGTQMSGNISHTGNFHSTQVISDNNIIAPNVR